MKIKTITGRNIKGRNFTLPLEAATIIVGPNSIGKTAVLDAIDLALLSYVPTLSRTNQGIFSLASANAMSVAIETDEGQQIERAWNQDAKGAVRSSDRIAGGLPPMPLVMLDANEFFSKSEAGRMEMIFGLMNLSAAPLTQRVADLRTMLADNAPALGVLGQMPNIPGETFQRWLERALASFSEAIRSESATAKAMKATQQSLAHLQLKDEGEAAPADLVAALAAARAALEVKREAKAAAEAELKNSSQIGQRRLALKIKRKAMTDVLDLKAEAENKIVEITAAMNEIRGIDDEKPLAAYYKATAEGEAMEKRCKEILAERRAKVTAIEKDRDEVLSHKECPTCFTNKPTWKRAATKRFEEMLEAAKEGVAECEASVETVQKAAAAARIDQQEAEVRAQKLQELTKQLRHRTSDLERCERAAEALVEIDKELADLPSGDHDTEAAASFHADQEFSEALQLVNDLEGAQQAAANEKSDQKRLAEAAEAFEKSSANAAKIKEGHGVLIEARSHYMQGGIDPLLTVANAFAKGILPSPLEFLNGEIGRTDKGRWIPSRGFSGAEQAITHAAISAALGSQAPIRIVLFDELGRLDNQSKERFMVNVIVALDRDNPKDDKRLIDQFIGADVSDTVYHYMNSNNAYGSARLHIIPLKA